MSELVDGADPSEQPMVYRPIHDSDWIIRQHLSFAEHTSLPPLQQNVGSTIIKPVLGVRWAVDTWPV